jgi:hypothetical protein
MGRELAMDHMTVIPAFVHARKVSGVAASKAVGEVGRTWARLVS